MVAQQNFNLNPTVLLAYKGTRYCLQASTFESYKARQPIVTLLYPQAFYWKINTGTTNSTTGNFNPAPVLLF